MAKATCDASLEHFGCFTHSLQLATNDGLLSQRTVKGIIAICKSIGGHFYRSSDASYNLKKSKKALIYLSTNLSRMSKRGGTQHFKC